MLDFFVTLIFISILIIYNPTAVAVPWNISINGYTLCLKKACDATCIYLSIIRILIARL